MLPRRSRARVSTSPTRAQASVRPNATELAGAIPPGTVIRQPTTTTATVNPKRTTWRSLNEVKAPVNGAGAATTVD